MRKARTLALALLIPGLAIVPLLAAGEGPKYDPDGVTAISEYLETCNRGSALYAKKDYTGAIDTYKKAIQLSPKNPLAHYAMGEAYVAAQNLPEAEAAFLAAEQNSDSKNPLLRSHVLFAVADVYEREHKPEQAKIAWQQYLEHATTYVDGGAFPDAGLERLRVVEALLQREKDYEKVRARIAAERDAGADAKK